MGNFEQEEKAERKAEMWEKLRGQLDVLAEQGNEFYDKGEFDEALRVWTEGLALIPEPKKFYSESVWFLASIGDIHFMRKNYSDAFKCFDSARGNLSGDGYANPFVMLRLGQCSLELGMEDNAAEFLMRAYMFEGKDIFMEDDRKYFDFLRTRAVIEE